MKYKTVFWDFNGTLLNDTAVSIDAINTVLSRRNMKTVDGLASFQEIFCFPVSEYYRRLGFDFDVEPYKVPADEWVELYSAHMYDAPLNPGIIEALSHIKKLGVTQIVLSASERGRLLSHLEMLGILDYFDDVIGTSDVYARGKSELAQKFALDNPHLFPALFVGDTDHDFECAKKMGCDCVLFDGGFMSRKRLLLLTDSVISSFDRLLTFFSDTSN